MYFDSTSKEADSILIKRFEEKIKDKDDHRNFPRGEFWKDTPLYDDVNEGDFLDTKWQLKNSITNKKTLIDRLSGVVDNDFIKDVEEGFHHIPMAVRVTPYVLSLIDWENPYSDPLRKQFIPLSSKLEEDHPELHLDTLSEQEDSPVSGLTHRYNDKVLFLALHNCPVYCRYCTRSYAVGLNTETVEKVKLSQNKARWDKMFDYLENHPTVEDVVLSGGDAYMLKPEFIRHIGHRLLKMPNIRRIRIATKGLAILPQKILTDNEWYNAVKEIADAGREVFKDVMIHTHFSHPNEITEISEMAMKKLMKDGIKVRNQAVLQRGVNDDPEVMIRLGKSLGYLNIQPYYVYMHDLVEGVEDLRTTLGEGIEIEKYVRGTTAGFNTPTFVVDAPGGGGKRDIHSYEHYNKETGISVYTAPSVKQGQYFMYFDPISKLKPSIQRAWFDEDLRKEMKEAALDSAKNGIK